MSLPRRIRDKLKHSLERPLPVTLRIRSSYPQPEATDNSGQDARGLHGRLVTNAKALHDQLIESPCRIFFLTGNFLMFLNFKHWTG